MALTLENDGAVLVAGAPFAQKKRAVRVLRAFFTHAGVAASGTTVSLPAVFAAEMVAAGKAVYVAEALPAAAKTAKKE